MIENFGFRGRFSDRVRVVSWSDAALVALGIHCFTDGLRLQQVFESRGNQWHREDMDDLRHVRDITAEFVEKLERRGGASDLSMAATARSSVESYDQAIFALEAGGA